MITTKTPEPEGGATPPQLNSLILFRMNHSISNNPRSLTLELKALEIKWEIKALEILQTWTETSGKSFKDLIFLKSHYFPKELVLVKSSLATHQSLVNFKGDPAERSSILHYQYSFDSCRFGENDFCLDKNSNPLTELSTPRFEPLEPGINQGKEKEIVIAVLDTGIAPELIPEEYLWVDKRLPKGENYFDNIANGVHGRNFVAGPESTAKEIDGKMVLGDPEILDIRDDHPLLHGTMMCAYIINQFRDSEYAVKIMCLKTHRANGTGDLEAIFRAIHYARYHGAAFINASWAFPAIAAESYSILRDAIQQVISENHALFVTVSGNRSSQFPELHYYPAKFGKRSPGSPLGVLVAATVDANKATVSPSEMHSNDYVDFGVPCDKDPFQFELPLKQELGKVEYRPGASIAAAIATGFLASRLPEHLSTNKNFRTKSGILEYDTKSSFSVYPALSDQVIGGRVLNLKSKGENVQESPK